MFSHEQPLAIALVRLIYILRWTVVLAGRQVCRNNVWVIFHILYKCKTRLNNEVGGLQKRDRSSRIHHMRNVIKHWETKTHHCMEFSRQLLFDLLAVRHFCWSHFRCIASWHWMSCIVRILQRYLGLRVDIKERMGHKEKKGELSTFPRQTAVLSMSHVKRRFRYRWWWLKGSRKKCLACCVVAWMCRDNEIIQWQYMQPMRNWEYEMAVHEYWESGRCLRASGWLVSKMNGLAEPRVISLLRLLLPHSNLYNCTRCSECPGCEHLSRITPVQVGLLKLQFDALFVVSIFVDFIFFVDMFLHLGLLVEAK